MNNNVVINYILSNFFKKFLIVTLIIYCFAIILNLFEEVEFFKNTEASILFHFINMYICTKLNN